MRQGGNLGNAQAQQILAQIVRGIDRGTGNPQVDVGSLLLPILLPHIMPVLRPIIDQITSDKIRRQLGRMGIQNARSSGKGSGNRPSSQKKRR